MKDLFIDSHAHLDFPEYIDDLDAVLARAAEAGVGFVLTVGTNLVASRRCMDLARRYPQVSASVGIHPHDASEAGPDTLEELAGLARKGAVAVGEIGLDFHRNRSPRDRQREAFRAQLEMAAALDLPVIVHSRNAWEETFAILEKSAPPGKGVVHCFSGGPDEAAQALSIGFHLSFAGPLTYPNARNTRASAASVPVERLLLETDSPFLAPQSRRGKRNEPALVVEVAEVSARLHDISLSDLGAVTTANARALFGMGPPIPGALIAYAIRDSLYLNVTNRCTAQCMFCSRETDPTVAGHPLRLPAEPTADEVKEAVRKAGPGRFREVVFCGYGEPTLRLELVRTVGRWLREQGLRVRLNTNGMANLIHGKDVTGDLAEAVMELSVSLNAQDAETYARTCRPRFGKSTHAGVLDFVEKARGRFSRITLTALKGVEGVDVEACRRIADRLGVGFRKRVYRAR